MRVPAIARGLLAGGIAASALLAGCGDLARRNEEAQRTIDKRALGMPAGDFFSTYGPWSARSELGDGGAVYLWESQVGKAVAGPYGLDDRVCKLRVTVDRRGRVAAVEIRQDNLGRVSTSRCGEIFDGRG